MKIVLRYKEKNSHRDDGYDGTEWGVREIENVNTCAKVLGGREGLELASLLANYL